MKQLTAASVLLVLLTGCTGADVRPDADGPGEPGTGASSAVDGSYRAPAGALLAAPADDAESNEIVVVLLDNIANTPRGATIRIVARSFSLVPVAAALVEAHARGVRVQVVADGDVSRDFQATGMLTDALGVDRREPSFLRLTRGSARGGPTEQHQKSWSFSRTGSSRHVVLVGSTNLSYHSVEDQYTDMYSFVGRRDVWRAFSAVFRDQARDRPLEDPAVSVGLGDDRAWFFPGFDTATEPVGRLLDRLPADGTRIRVAMYAWVDPRGIALARRLADLAREGAEVEVIAARALGAEPERILTEAGVPVRRAVFDDGDDVHLKLLLADYVGADGRRHRLISTGSDNFTSRSLQRDEVVVHIDADRGPAYGRYQRFLDEIDARIDAEG